MKTRNFVLSALGLAAAITFGGAAQASAQAKSQKRIPVRKDDKPAETPMAMRPDTVFIRSKPDTVMMHMKADTVMMRMKPDTVMQMQMLPVQRLPGLYFGLGGGVAVPANSWIGVTKPGPLGQVQVGYFPADGPIGLESDHGQMEYRRIRVQELK